eukprot:549871_1
MFLWPIQCHYQPKATSVVLVLAMFKQRRIWYCLMIITIFCATMIRIILKTQSNMFIYDIIQVTSDNIINHIVDPYLEVYFSQTQHEIDQFTYDLHQIRNEWGIPSTLNISTRYKNITNTLYNKTVLFIGDSTIRVTVGYFINCICVQSQQQFNQNDCKYDRLLIDPSGIGNGPYGYQIRKGISSKTFSEYQCSKYNAKIIWYKHQAADINIQIPDKVTKYLNLSNLSNIILNPSLNAESNDILHHLHKYINHIDILIFNLGLHLHQELRRSDNIKLQIKRGENINALLYYELYLKIIKNNVWNQLAKSSNKSCLFFQTTQDQNCHLMYGDRLCLFANNINVTYFNKWYKDWDDYLLQCSNTLDVPIEICDNAYPGKLHINLNIQLRNYVTNHIQRINPKSKTFIADIGYVTNDTDFCHHNDFIHKQACASAKVFYFLNLFHITGC